MRTLAVPITVSDTCWQTVGQPEGLFKTYRNDFDLALLCSERNMAKSHVCESAASAAARH